MILSTAALASLEIPIRGLYVAAAAWPSSLLCYSSSSSSKSAATSQLQRDAWIQFLGDLRSTKHHPHCKHDGCTRGGGPVCKPKTKRASLGRDGPWNGGYMSNLLSSVRCWWVTSTTVDQEYYLVAEKNDQLPATLSAVYCYWACSTYLGAAGMMLLLYRHPCLYSPTARITPLRLSVRRVAGAAAETDRDWGGKHQKVHTQTYSYSLFLVFFIFDNYDGVHSTAVDLFSDNVLS